MSLDSMSPENDRRFTLGFWTVMLAVTVVDIITVFLDIAPGLGPDKHPPEYLFLSNIAIFLLISVVPALRLAGLVRMPWWFNMILAFDCYLYVVSLTCGFYKEDSLPWWGFLGHTCSSMSVSALCFLALCLVMKHSNIGLRYGSTAGFLFVLFFVSISFGGIWEVMEGYIDIVAGTDYMSYGVFDSIMDMEADTLGALIMCTIAGLLLRNRTPEDIAASTHLSRPKKKRA